MIETLPTIPKTVRALPLVEGRRGARVLRRRPRAITTPQAVSLVEMDFSAMPEGMLRHILDAKAKWDEKERRIQGHKAVARRRSRHDMRAKLSRTVLSTPIAPRAMPIMADRHAASTETERGLCHWGEHRAVTWKRPASSPHRPRKAASPTDGSSTESPNLLVRGKKYALRQEYEPAESPRPTVLHAAHGQGCNEGGQRHRCGRLPPFGVGQMSFLGSIRQFIKNMTRPFGKPTRPAVHISGDGPF